MSEGFLPPIVAVIKGNIRDFEAKMAEADATMAESEKSFGGKAKGMGKSAGILLAGVGAIAGGIAAYALNAADKLDTAHAHLETVTKNAGENIDTFSKQLAVNENHFADLGINAAKYEDALAQLVPAVGSVEKATHLMGLAADLAANRHIDLNKAAILLGKVSEGNTTILKRFGIDLGIQAGGLSKSEKAYAALVKAGVHLQRIEEDIHHGRLKGTRAARELQDAQDKVKASQDALTSSENAGTLALDALRKKFGGTAQNEATTFDGKLRALHAHADNLAAKLGVKLQKAIDGNIKGWTNIAIWYDTKGFNMFKGWGAALEDHIVMPLDHIYHKIMALYGPIASAGQWFHGFSVSANRDLMSLGGAFADLMGASTHDDSSAIFARNDKKMGWAPGTTAKKVHAMGSHAEGGMTDSPVGGALHVLHGKELVLPMGNRPRAEALLQAHGLGGRGGGGVTIGTVHLTVVSPDADSAGEVVMNTLTDASFLSGRN